MNEKMSKSKKKKIIAFSVAGVIIVAAVILISVFQNAIYSQGLYTLMPKSQVSTLSDGSEVTVYVKQNPDYNPMGSAPPLEAFEFYYIDENGNEVNIEDAEGFEYNISDYQTAFVLFAGQKMQTIKSVATPIIVVLVVAILAVCIFLWFKSWSRRQDEEKARKYKKIQ
ncbi:MAG: hypothetical protein NC397_03075 [Clostridium sp.]|nr:hypothetical protein [Clostridium sp.]